MPRPTCCRRVAGPARCGLFKPAGVPGSALEELVLTVDELEALRLADLAGLYQEQAAQQMNISRQTFGRIVESARRKTARALIEGCALRIEGGTVEVVTMRRFQCSECGQAWESPHGVGRPAKCPRCQGSNIHRAAEDRGWARGGGQGRGRGRCRRLGAGGRRRAAGMAIDEKPDNTNEGESA